MPDEIKTTKRPACVTAKLFGKTADMTRWFTQFGNALISPTRDDGTDKTASGTTSE